MDIDATVAPILAFLNGIQTPDAWVEEAAKPENLQLLLTDHADNEHSAGQAALTIMRRYGRSADPIRQHKGNSDNCEEKAAATAINLMYRYAGSHTLLNKMSRLAREELRHFEQVIAIMQQRGIAYPQISASRYAGGLRKFMRNTEPGRMVDTLLVGAIIEARSCERFAKLVPVLDDELAQFYASLLKSESRHFKDYLQLAKDASSDSEVDERLGILLEAEKGLIEATDSEFRFHSGPPDLDKVKH